MGRVIYTVNAMQVVVSESHPEGVWQNVPNFPKEFDSRNYNATAENPNGDSDTALIVAQAEYTDQIKVLALANNQNRVMWTVAINRADGQNIARKTWGSFPDMTPSEPENEEEFEASE